MNTLNKIGFLLLVTLLIFTSCRKDEDTHGSFEPIPPTPDVIYNGSLSGIVADENNQAIEDALVSFANNSITTDENGYFSFKDVAINSTGSLVSVEKEGYFYNAKFVGTKLNKQNHARFKMIEKALTGSFSASSGGTISTSDGASVEFAANAIKKEGGEAYAGNVNVYATWLDPTAADLAQRMPGDLRAMNSENNQQQLTTFGMIGVELESDAGESLNIAEGQTATIEIPLPSELAANAPASIPLWHFDETSGYWVEEGEATLQNGKYVGTVSHFSFWNCDVPNDFVFIEGIVTGPEGILLEDVLVMITETSSGVSGFDWTDENGVYSGAVPANQELTISILNNCDEEIYSANIGPFSDDATIPTIMILTVEEFITISGTLINCDNNPVTNGYLKVDLGYTTVIIPSDANGEFSEDISICDGTTIDVTGFDLDGFKQSVTTTEDISGLTDLNLFSLYVCEDLNEFMTFNVVGAQVTDPDPEAIVGGVDNPGLLRIRAFNPDPNFPIPYVIITLFATEPGVYTPNYVDVTFVDPTTGDNYYVDCTAASCEGKIDVEFTTFEVVGGFVIGSFSGTLDPESLQLGDSQEVSGTFKIMLEE